MIEARDVDRSKCLSSRYLNVVCYLRYPVDDELQNPHLSVLILCWVDLVVKICVLVCEIESPFSLLCSSPTVEVVQVPCCETDTDSFALVEVRTCDHFIHYRKKCYCRSADAKA
jgi:hypothetical protein